MWTIEAEIENALSTIKPDSKTFKRLDQKSSSRIVEMAKGKYVLGNPRSWWLGLRLPYDWYEYDFPSEYLVNHAPNNETDCYWIPETEAETLVVYEAKISIISEIMGLTPSFDYYVLGKKCDWLMIENDHSQLIVIRG